MSDETRFDLEFQIDQLELTVQKIGELSAPDRIPLSEAELALVAYALHGVYNGIEGCIRLVLLARGWSLPSGAHWHTTLLEMASEVDVQHPPLLTDDLVDALRPLLAFRHVFRNAYFFQIDDERALDLARHTVTWWPAIKEALHEARSDP